MTSYAKRIRDLSPPAGVLAAYDRASVAHGFRKGRDRAAEIAAQADAEIRSMRAEAARDKESLDRMCADPDRAQVTAVKVRPLEWTVATGYGGTSFGGHEAQTMLGEYSCRKRGDGQWSVWKGERPLPDQLFDTIEAAKAAAQADYERRILSTLEAE